MNIFELSDLLFVAWFAGKAIGTGLGFGIISIRQFLRFALPHGIPEILGISINWAMVLAGQWHTPAFIASLVLLLIAGFIEANVSNPYFEKVYLEKLDRQRRCLALHRATN